MNIMHQPEHSRFYTVVEGFTAHVKYLISDEGLDIRHTVVPQEIGGRGIASALVKAAYDYARTLGLTPLGTCSYAVKWLEKHPEYEGKTGSDFCGEGSCAL